MRKILLGAALALMGVLAIGALVVGAGLYNVAADEEHTDGMYVLIEMARERSIASRLSDIQVPDLADPQRVRRGAGNYDSMCAGCHLKPGAEETELSRGLYPRPPDLATSKSLDPARAFWVIKHGIKATGMPAWGKSMEDSYIWDMVAFIGKLPAMDAQLYAAEVEASEGHSHGGGESTLKEHSDKHEHGDEHQSPPTKEHSHASQSSNSHAQTKENDL